MKRGKVRLIKKGSLEEFRYRWEGANAREGTSISSVVMDEMIRNIREIVISSAEDICKMIDDIELSYRDTSLEEWKAFKHIRNAIRDKYTPKLFQKDQA